MNPSRAEIKLANRLNIFNVVLTGLNNFEDVPGLDEITRRAYLRALQNF